MEFNSIWARLLENGASSRKEEGTRRYWERLSEEQQEAAFTNISRKMRTGEFVHYDPIQAIKENCRRVKEPEPEFLIGNEGGDLVQVLYKGMYKICTRATMELFGLQWIKDWN